MGLGERSQSSTREKWSARRGSGGRVAAALRVVTCVALAVATNAIATAARPAGSKMLTVERIYSAPNLSGNLTEGLEWTPDSKRVSYFGRDNSGVELWTTDAATGQSKILVNANLLKSAMPPEKIQAIQSTGLGRVEAVNYIWSPSGNSLLLIGGSSLVLLDLDTMTPKTLVSGAFDIDDPKFSPDGKWVSFVRESNLWVVNLATGDVKPLTTGGSEDVLKGKLDWVYPEELETSTAYWWSPDSSKVAYYQMDERPVTRYPIMDMSSPLGAIEYERYPQAGEENPIVHVGVVPVAGGATTWMDTGADTDVYLARVEWLPDSRRVAIERLNRAQNELDLLFCDAATGASSKILTETDKFWINIADDLYFFSDGKRFLWSSERTGFRHYYLYDLAGNELEQLTSGEWGITGNGGFGPGASSHPAVDEARGYIYFVSNKDNVRGRELYRLSLADKSITRITRADGCARSAYRARRLGLRRHLLERDDSAAPGSISHGWLAHRRDQRRQRARTRRLRALSRRISDRDGERRHQARRRNDQAARFRSLAKISRPRSTCMAARRFSTCEDDWGDTDFLWLEMMAEKGLHRLRAG